MTKTWWEAPMGGSVLSFLKADWKVSDTGSVGWAFSWYLGVLIENKCNEKYKKFEDAKGIIRHCKLKKDTQYNILKKKD
jgi:hypothetical protein